MVSVYIGIASRNDGSWGMFQSLLNNIIQCSQAGIQVMIQPHVGDSLICRARNEMTWKFLQSSCTHFLQVDDDIELPDNAIVKLVQADKDVIGGAYRLRSNDAKGEGHAALRGIEEFKIQDHPNEVLKLKYLSTGCFMQKRETVEDMWGAYPDLAYMANLEKAEFAERRALYQTMIYGTEYLSEDWAYCQRLADAGYDIWLHTGVLCGHWGIQCWEFKLETEATPLDIPEETVEETENETRKTESKSPDSK